MVTVFLKPFNMGIAAGWLILAVMALRLLLHKAPKWLPCILWAFVAIRLACPFSLENMLSLIPSAETVSPAVMQYAQEPAIDSGIPAINDLPNPMIMPSKFIWTRSGPSLNTAAATAASTAKEICLAKQ